MIINDIYIYTLYYMYVNVYYMYIYIHMYMICIYVIFYTANSFIVWQCSKGTPLRIRG